MSRINLEYFLARRIAFTRGGRKNNVMVRIATLSVAVGMAVMIVSPVSYTHLTLPTILLV